MVRKVKDPVDERGKQVKFETPAMTFPEPKDYGRQLIYHPRQPYFSSKREASLREMGYEKRED